MINLNVETTINGRVLRADSRLNALITDYILDNLGVVPEEASERKVKVMGRIIKWDEDETLRFAQRVEELHQGGTKDGQIGFALHEEFQKRTPGSLYQKIKELQKKGIIKYK